MSTAWATIIQSLADQLVVWDFLSRMRILSKIEDHSATRQDEPMQTFS